jgi:hypothetical protein
MPGVPRVLLDHVHDHPAQHEGPAVFGCSRDACQADGGGPLRRSADDDLAGAGTDPEAGLGFLKRSATVAPAPYGAYAATKYRRH